ncbi:MAG: 6-bladed beta-propeller [Gemmatimonadota bacterium]
MMIPVAVLALSGLGSPLLAQATPRGPVGPSPYEPVTGWHKPFSQAGFAFGGNSGVFAESPDRIFVLQRGEARLPTPVPPGYEGYAGSVGINVLMEADRRVWRNCLYVLDGDGNVIEQWNKWDILCENSDGPGPHRVRINPYDPDRSVWVVNETFHQIYVFSNDGSELLRTFGEKHVAGDDETHFARPQDVAFLPDGRVLIADGLDNHRLVVLDAAGNYLTEIGEFGDGPGQFNGIHAVATGPGGRIFALDRSGGRINVFRTTDDPAEFEFVDVWDGLSIPLDIIVNDESLWITDLSPLRFIKYDFQGNQLYTWMVPSDPPNGFLEVHTISVDSEGNLYGGDNQNGRSLKWVPRPGADPALLIDPPWVAR